MLTENRKSTSYPADECAILKKKSLSANKILQEKLADMSTPHEDNGAYLRASYHTAVSLNKFIGNTAMLEKTVLVRRCLNSHSHNKTTLYTKKHIEIKK